MQLSRLWFLHIINIWLKGLLLHLEITTAQMNLTIWRIVEMSQLSFCTGPQSRESSMLNSANKTIA